VIEDQHPAFNAVNAFTAYRQLLRRGTRACDAAVALAEAHQCGTGTRRCMRVPRPRTARMGAMTGRGPCRGIPAGMVGWVRGCVSACTWHSIYALTHTFHAGFHVCKKHASKKYVLHRASCLKSACTLKGCKQRHTVLMQGRCATQYDDTQPHAE